MQNGLLTRLEIAYRLGISRERVRQLTLHPDFPRPVGHVGRAAAWQHDEIADWARRKGRRLAERLGLAEDGVRADPVPDDMRLVSDNRPAVGERRPAVRRPG